jgi:hypothetical protein
LPLFWEILLKVFIHYVICFAFDRFASRLIGSLFVYRCFSPSMVSYGGRFVNYDKERMRKEAAMVCLE